MKVTPIVLSGGIGSRLWPLSRALAPKQLLPLVDSEKSLFQETLLRLNGMVDTPPMVICNAEHRFIIAEQLREIGKIKNKIILEPMGKNTAPAAALAAFYAVQEDKDAILLILPADHKIENVDKFHEALMLGSQCAEQDKLVTFGVTVTKPETGYGYIKAGKDDQDGFFPVDEFIEKPDQKTAESFYEAGHYYWNSGMFMFKASSYLQELKSHANDIYETCQKACQISQTDLDFIRLDDQAFQQCRADSIDYAVMEHTKNAVVVPLDVAWSDVGSWTSLWEVQPQDEQGNVILGDVLTQGVKNSYLRADNRLLVTIGMENCIVVETNDAVLVADKNKTQEIKQVVEKLKENKREEAHSHHRAYRPWGYYENLIENPGYKVKRICVKPGASLSLQMHHQRAEHWVVVDGIAEVTNGEEIFTLNKNQSTYISVGTKHRLQNPGKEMLTIIEVQSGDYLGEDDIVRFEDRYGRVE